MLKMLDMSAQIAALPRHPNAQMQPPRGVECWITLHYSGVLFGNRSRVREEQRILVEAAYHLRRSWSRPGQPPLYGSRYQYDFVVLSDGTIVRCQPDRAVLWHCGNRTGNAQSWSVHVLTGPGQPLTAEQRASLYALFDALRIDAALPRNAVVAHCEWPRGDGPPRVSDIYRRQPGQSVCPGAVVFADLVRYRKMT